MMQKWHLIHALRQLYYLGPPSCKIFWICFCFIQVVTSGVVSGAKPVPLPLIGLSNVAITRGGVEDTRLEAKAKDTKKIRGQGQGQPFRGQTLSRPRTGMLGAKAKDQGHKAQVLSKKKKKGLHKNFSGDLQKKKKKKKKKGLHKNFSSDLH